MFFLAHVRNWFVVSLIKALELKSDLRLYKFEKKIVAARNDFDDDDSDKRDESRKIFGFAPSSFQKLKKKIDVGPEDFGVFRNVVNDGTTENFVVKSAFGFLGGIILTFVCYLFLIYSLNFTLRRATLICVGLGVILSLGLAFSVRIRCTVLLCMPQLFSKRGRQALLGYAFILALSGPAKNTLHNVEVMSESLACGQEQLKKAENELLKCVHRPSTAVKQSLENMISKLDIAVKGYKNVIEKFYRECEAVIETIIHAQEWLYSIYCLCNEKMGSPYSRCADLLLEAGRNCEAVSGAEDWQKACIVSSVQDLICPMSNDPICSIQDMPPFWPFLNLQKQLNEFRKEALNLIYVKIETREIFAQPNRTATLHEEYQGMATEIRQKTDQFLQYFDVMSVIFGIFILVLFIKVLIYRYKFLTEDEYDNRFITSDFIDIDRTRAEFGMQTLLPLETRERKQYIRVTSMRLVAYERKRLLSSFVFLVFATFKIIIHMLTDCSLFWMLSTMRRHGRMLLISSDGDVPQISVTVSGEGLFAELLQNVTKTVRPYAVQQILDPIPCLPDPISPDWNRYLQIMTLVLICWFLAFCEPYGLRLRHIVMVTYHPERARERAIWLYNRILTTRKYFVKFTRRQLRRRYKDVDEQTFFGYRYWVWKRRLKCMVCKEDLKDVAYIKCPTVGCVGIYCRPCFETLQLCSICKDPSHYGDYSDVSEEKDSDQEEENISCSRCRCYSASQTYPRREPIEDYHISQMTYDPVPNVRNWMHPKFQISMDTIIDLDEVNPQQSNEPASDKKGNLPVRQPSIMTRLVQQWRRAFGRRKIFGESNHEGKSPLMQNQKKEPEEAACRNNKKSGKLSRKPFLTRRKPSISAKAIQNLRIFRWKLKEGMSVEAVSENFSDFRERFKNVYFVDLDQKRITHRNDIRWRERSSSSGANSQIENIQQEWKESVETLRKLLSSDSLHLLTCPRRTEKVSYSRSRNCSSTNFICPVHGSGKFSASKEGWKEHFQLDRESEGDRQHKEFNDKETQTQLVDSDVQGNSGGLHHQRVSSSRSSSRTFSSPIPEQVDAGRRRKNSWGSVRRKRRGARWETTSESSPEGKHSGRWRRSCGRKSDADAFVQNVLTKKVDLMRVKLAQFLKRNAKKPSSSEDGPTTDGEDCQPFQYDEELNGSGRKIIRPDLLSDLPSSKTSTGRDAVDKGGDSGE